MEVELTVTLEIEQEEGQPNEVTFELLLDYLKGSLYDNGMVTKIVDMDCNEV